jgi:hypothetical protein
MLLGFLLHWLPSSLSDKAKAFVTRCPLLVKAVILISLIYLVIQIKSSDVQPFIYFQF